MKIYITGLGVISAIGNNVEENYNSLQGEKTGIEKIKFLPFDSAVLTGEVKLSNETLIAKMNLKNGFYSRTSLLGIAAAKECWKKNSLNQNIRTGIISATSVGGMDKTEKYYRQVLQKKTSDISLILTHDSGTTTEKIAEQLGINGYINTNKKIFISINYNMIIFIINSF